MPALIVTSSYPLLAGLVLIGALGLPLPLSVTLAAAGALARQGHLRLSLLFAVCAAAAVLGDCLGYAAGRTMRRLRIRAPRARRFAAAQAICSRLSRRMGTLVFITRWAVTAPAPLVNVMAGARRYPMPRFLLVALCGEALWCATALAPGYLIGGIPRGGIALAMGAGLLLTLLGSALVPRLYTRWAGPLRTPERKRLAA
jgi:membrane protein DedA with SNARE-associated domain